MNKLSIIIPVFNEEKTILKLVKKVIDLDLGEINKEVIIVNDGSSDSTESEIKNYLSPEGKKFKIENLKVINHKRNQGKGAAVSTGIRASTGDYIVIQDADLEYNPDDIRNLASHIINGESEVVYGTRLNRMPNLSRDEDRPLFLIHYLGNRFLSLVTSILYGQWITDMETCYKMFPRKAAEKITLKAKRFDFEPEITSKLLKKGYKILEIPISTKPRGYDEGKKLNTLRDGFIALWTLFKYRFI